jgi:hypothetical protein
MAFYYKRTLYLYQNVRRNSNFRKSKINIFSYLHWYKRFHKISFWCQIKKVVCKISHQKYIDFIIYNGCIVYQIDKRMYFLIILKVIIRFSVLN